MDKKKIIYIGSLLILTVIVSITYFSYAFFTNRTEQRGKLNIVTGTLDYKIKSSDLTNNSITLEANKSKQIEIEITSLNKISSKYELYYQTTASNIVVGYGSSNDTPTGTINSNGKKTVKLVIKNKSNSQATIVFGVEGGFISNELVLSTGSHITDIIDNVCNYNSGYVWNFPFDPDGDGEGQVQTFTVPCAGAYKVELWGASASSPRNNGLGGYTSGNIVLKKSDILYVYVGEEGKEAVPSSINNAYNGGGKGGLSTKNTSARNGGGATDIRYFGNTTPSSTDLVWNSSIGLKSRIMVAGAAGGGSANELYSTAGGSSSGGGLIGSNGAYYSGHGDLKQYGAGGTQVSGGVAGKNIASATGTNYPGTFGIGGTSNSTSYWNGAGGGGSGYYGGGSGGSTQGSGAGNGAGGGSSFISGYSGCNAISESSTLSNIIHTGQPNHYSGYVFTNGVMIDGNGCNWATGSASNCGANQPQPDGTNATGHTGNGYARITYLGDNDIEDKTTMGYVVSFDTNGGTVSPSTKIINMGDQIGSLPTPTKDDNYFEGWYLESNFTTKVDATYVPTGTITLYARYGTEVNMNLDSRTRGYPSDTTLSDTTRRSYNMNTYVVGLAWSNHYNPASVKSYSLTSTSSYIKASSGYGIGIPMQLATGHYILIGNVSTTYEIVASIIKYASDGTCSTSVKQYNNNDNIKFGFDINAENSYEAVVIATNGTEQEGTVSNLHLYKLD